MNFIHCVILNFYIMYSATKKTRSINAFRRECPVNARDLYAKYGMRINPKAVHGTDSKSSATVIPEGSSVIGSMISAQNVLRNNVKSPEQE